MFESDLGLKTVETNDNKKDVYVVNKKYGMSEKGGDGGESMAAVTITNFTTTLS